MPLVDLKTNLKDLRFGKDRKGGGSSRQPYVQIGIPETPFEEALASPLGVKDFLLRGGVNAVTDTAEDIVRLGSFFTNPFNPSGLLFTAKQNILSNSAVRTQASGIQNEGIYTPLSTLSQAGVVAFGGHLNKQGLNPFALTGAYSNNPNLYAVRVKSTQPKSRNRLVQIYEAIENNAPVSTIEGYEYALGPNIISYNGGPGSNLGVGRTNIRYADQRTGLQNANLAGSPIQTQRFKAPKISGGTFDYSVFERKTVGESFFNIIFNKGASAQYLKQEGYTPELFDGLINEQGQLIRGGQDATGDRNSLAVTNPTFFYTGSNQTQGANYLDQIIKSGATADYIRRTGSYDPNLLEGLVNSEGQIIRGGQDQTGEFNALAVTNPTFFYTGSNKTQGANYLDQIISGGATADYIKREGEKDPNLLDGLVNEEGQIIRGGQDTTGDLNSLAVTRPGYFYGKPGETGKSPFIPGNYLQSLSLLTNGGLNTLNRNWNSVSKTFSSLSGLSGNVKLDNQMNNEGEILYNPSVTKGGNILETDTSVTTRDGAASLTQEQILNKILSRTNGTTQVRDFRREIGPDTIGFENYVEAFKNGTLTRSPNYVNPNVRFEGRVNLGDPGKKGLMRSDYSKGALGLDGKANVVDKINAMYMYNADSVTTDKEKNDFVKFRFAVINPDQPTEKTFVHFRAIFDGAITDNMSAKWDSFKYLGRAEDFYNYTGFTREIGFSFIVVAQSKPELSIMYQKLNYLQSSLTPNYNQTNGFMRGNIHQLTIGGYFYEQPGVITSLNYTMPGDSPWEIGIPSNFSNRNTTQQGPPVAPGEESRSLTGIKSDPSVKELPHRIEVQVGFNPIHTFLPQIVGSAFDANNPGGIYGKGDIDQRYIALANENSVSLYTKGTPYATKISEYDPQEENTEGEE